MPYLAGFATPQDYGATGNGTTDDTAAIQSALNAVGLGGVVYLPPGAYGVSAPLYIPPQVTLWGSHSSHIDSTTCAIKALSTFSSSAAAMILMVDQATGGYSVASNQQRLLSVTLDGSNITGSTVDGIQFQGFVHGVIVEDVQVRNVPNHYVNIVSNSSGVAYSGRFTRVLGNTCGGYGYAVGAMTDTTWIDVESIAAGKSGWLLAAAPSNSKFIGCRSEYSNWNGWEISGAWTGGTAAGGPTLTDCSTDGNNRNGILITATGDSPLTVIGGSFRRDGANGTSGGGGYAAIQCTGSTIPVTIVSPTVYPGVAQTGGANSPQYGFAVGSSSSNASVGGGVLHAATQAWYDDGTNTNISRGANIIERVGTESSYTTAFHGLQSSLAAPPTWDSGAGSTVYSLVADTPLPEDQSLIAWTYDPALQNASNNPTGGVVYLIRFVLRRPLTVTNVILGVASAPSGLTTGENFAGLYNSGGTLLSATADQSTNWAGTGEKVMALTTAQAVKPGIYYVGFVANASTTTPGFSRVSTQSSSIVNAGTTSSNPRYATILTGQTSLPSSVSITSAAASSISYWAALS